MKIKELKTSSGRSVKYFDDVFDLNTRQYFSTFCQNSCFKLNGTSNSSWETTKRFIVSYFTKEDLDMSRLFNGKQIQDILQKYIGDRKAIRQWVLFQDLSTKQYLHYDGDFDLDKPLSLLYYVNLHWQSDWGGETIFAADDGEPEIIVPYKPGRIVIFDSKIPHRATFVSPEAPWRLSFNMVFN